MAIKKSMPGNTALQTDRHRLTHYSSPIRSRWVLSPPLSMSHNMRNIFLRISYGSYFHQLSYLGRGSSHQPTVEARCNKASPWLSFRSLFQSFVEFTRTYVNFLCGEAQVVERPLVRKVDNRHDVSVSLRARHVTSTNPSHFLQGNKTFIILLIGSGHPRYGLYQRTRGR